MLLCLVGTFFTGILEPQPALRLHPGHLTLPSQLLEICCHTSLSRLIHGVSNSYPDELCYSVYTLKFILLIQNATSANWQRRELAHEDSVYAHLSSLFEKVLTLNF